MHRYTGNKKNKLTLIFEIIVTILLFATLPYILAAASLGKQTSFSGLVDVLIGYINTLIALVMSGSVLMFFYGVAKFILNVGNSKDYEAGKKLMLWGLIGLFVMSSIFGIINFFVVDTF